MGRTGKMATWLEAAAAPYSGDTNIRLRAHPLLHEAEEAQRQCGNQCCYAISIDGRWLHANDGRLTILKGLHTVDRFMNLIRVSDYETGEPARIQVDCGKTAFCLAADPNKVLRRCT
jgi:hypothetical protein